jgi:hypothetical protein
MRGCSLRREPNYCHEGAGGGDEGVAPEGDTNEMFVSCSQTGSANG